MALRLGPDGTVETIALTREILLNPSLDVQVPQNRPHFRRLKTIIERLDAFFKPKGRFQILSDVIVKWPNERKVAADVWVFEKLDEKPGKRTPDSVSPPGTV